SIAINPKSAQIAWKVGTTIRIVDAQNGKEAPKIEIPFGKTDLRFSGDGKSLLTKSMSIEIWDLATDKRKYELSSGNSKPQAGGNCAHVCAFEDQRRVWATATMVGANPSVWSLVRFAADGKKWDAVQENIGVYPKSEPHAAGLSQDRRFLAFADRTSKEQG